MRKKFLLACVAGTAMAISLMGCGTEDTTTTSATTDTTNSTEASQTQVTGKVSSISDGTVTLALGEVDKNAGPGQGGSSDDSKTPPEMPDNNNASDIDNNNSNASGSNNNSDNSDNNQTPPELPDNANGNGNGSGDDNGSSDSNGNGSGAPGAGGTEASGTEAGSPGTSGPGQGGMPGFTESGETQTIDISNATITKDDETIDMSDIVEGDILEVTLDAYGDAVTVEVITLQDPGGDQAGGGPGAGGAPGGNSSGTVTQGLSATTLSEDGTYSDETYTSTGDDENALRIDNATVTLDGITIDKSAGATSSTENGDFYGVNAALLATNGATVTIKNATVTSSAQNGNGVFSYGSGTTVNISDSTITTTADNSGGIQTTGGGTTNASNLTVDTSGNSSAAIRSDRGGGTVNVDGGSYTSNGYNSPTVYSTAAITIKDAALTANNSEALVIEGQNSIDLEDCTVSGNMSDTKGTSSDENVHNVMIYQSMSGDADVGTSSFSMTGGNLTSNNGAMFYITNTDCTLSLSGVDIVNKDSDAYLMNITGNSASHGWGTAGANGAQVTFTADDQTLEGDIRVDSISTLNMTLSGNSTFTGTINIDENEEGGEAVSDNAVVTIEEGSTWTLTGDCTITSLTNNGTINFNGYTITLADGTVLK